MKTPITAKVDVPKEAFEMAACSARLWFRSAEVGEEEVRVQVSPEELANVAIREKVCSLAGNTPGLADVLVEALNSSRQAGENLPTIVLQIRRRDAAAMPVNNPMISAVRVRQALS